MILVDLVTITVNIILSFLFSLLEEIPESTIFSKDMRDDGSWDDSDPVQRY